MIQTIAIVSAIGVIILGLTITAGFVLLMIGWIGHVADEEEEI